MTEELLDNDNERLLQIVKELQSNVVGYEKKKQTAGQSVIIDLYPKALDKTEAKDIGIILDEKHSVTDLVGANKINPPDKLYWLQITTYADFVKFLETKGIPAYVSFNSLTSPSSAVSGKESGVRCANVLIMYCTKHKVSLPKYDCHCPIITMKQKIELLLLDYEPPKQ